MALKRGIIDGKRGGSVYKTGDLVVYGRTGVCRVEGVRREKDGRAFYALRPLYQSCDILTPVEGKVPIRPVISGEEADRLIDLIPTLEAKPVSGADPRALSSQYQAAIATCDCRELIRLTMSIYAKKKTTEREKRKFGAVDQRFMQEGESLLYGELGAALGLGPEEVPGYIGRRLGRGREGKTVP